MFNLQDSNISYLIITPSTDSFNEKFLCEKLSNILYGKDYTVIQISGYQNQKYEKSFFAICPDDNDRLRNDALYLINEFNQDSIIIKYRDEIDAKKILSNGSELLLGLSIYESEPKNKIYIHNGISFSFTEQKRYIFPKSKEELKSGMIVEFFNNNKWIQKKITDIDSEYDKMYKLLIKYEKLRVCNG